MACELKTALDEYMRAKVDFASAKRRMKALLVEEFNVPEYEITDSVIVALDKIKLFGRGEEC